MLTALLLALGCANAATPALSPSSEQRIAAANASPEHAGDVRPEPPPEVPIEDESVQSPAWLGVELAVRLPEEPGVLVRGVVPDSPAERAGIVKDDVILSIDGRGVASPAEVVLLVGRHRVGDRVGILLKRGDRERLFAATLESLPNDESMMRKRYVESVAPAFSDLKTVRGNLDPSLSALRGNVVVVEFWAGWCVPCRITAPLLSGWSDRYSAEGLRVVGVTSDPFLEAAEAAARHGISYAVFSDESGRTTLSYRAFALPTLFVIDRRGIVRDVMVGFSTSRLREVQSLLETLLAER